MMSKLKWLNNDVKEKLNKIKEDILSRRTDVLILSAIKMNKYQYHIYKYITHMYDRNKIWKCTRYTAVKYYFEKIQLFLIWFGIVE